MLYLNDSSIRQIGTNWPELIEVIENATHAFDQGEYSQPLKPYLRYEDNRNRIIAMPAYIGGTDSAVGIKWVASFPNNYMKDLPRAHSVLILNEVDTGKPLAVFNSALLSAVRTVSVSATFLKHTISTIQSEKLNVMIFGLGPIGELHYNFLMDSLSDRIQRLYIYDTNLQKAQAFTEKYADSKIVRVDSWEDAFQHSDIILTCTVVSEPYINIPAKVGAIILNISLRDFGSLFYKYSNPYMVVDDWDEVCREGTTVERLYNQKMISPSDSIRLADIVVGNRNMMNDANIRTIFFNPMGMAVYDIAIAKYYLVSADQRGVGNILCDS